MRTGDDAAPHGMPGGSEITWVRYDAGVLSLAWIASPNPATTYVVEVYAESPHPVATVEAGRVFHAAFPVDLPTGRDYTVQVQTYVGNAPKGTSDPVAVVTGTTAVATAETDPATGALTLRWPGAAADRFLLRLAVNGAPPDPDTVVTGPATTLEVPPQPPGCVAAATLARVVQSRNATSTGPYGRGFAVPTERPDLLAADVDGATLHAAWTAVTGATAYRLTVLHDGAVSFQHDVAAPATEAAVTPGAMDGAYALVVQAVFSTGSGPASEPLALLLGAPAVTAVTYDGAVVAVAVTPPPGTAPEAYGVVVRCDGSPVAAATVGAASPLRLAVYRPPASGVACTVAVRARIGLTSGPETAAPVVLAAPDVAAVACGTDLLVTAAPGALPAGVAIEAVLYVDGVPGTPQRVDPDGTTTFPIPSGAAAVAVRGVDGVAIGPWSGPVPAPTTPPVFTNAIARGDGVHLTWTGVPGARYLVEAGGVTAAVRENAATLPPADGDATVTEVAGVATGPPVRLPIVARGPVVESVTTRAGRLVTIAWTPPPEPALDTVQPVVRWGGTEVALPAVPATTNPVVLTLPAEIPGSATVALRGSAGVATGPPGNAVALLTVAPAGLAVTYDGATVVATWDPVNDPAVDRYAVTLAAAETTVVVTPGPSARIPYAGGGAPTVTVEAMAGEIARGVPSAPVDVLVAAPAVTAAIHDGTDLHLAWTGGAAAYLVAVESGGVAAHLLETGDTQAVLAVPPGPWTAAVRATGEGTTGPAATVPLLTSAPASVTVTYDAVTGVATLRWAAVPGATGYAITVENGTENVATADVTKTSCPINPLPAGGAYTATVRPTATTAGRQVVGPPATTALLATPPAGVTATYDGTIVRASWQPVAGASGYRLSTVAGGVATALADTAGTSGAWPFTTTDETAALVVQPLGGDATGAPSTPSTLFPESLFLGASYVVPQTGPVLTPATIALALPQLFTTPPATVDGLPLGITLTPAGDGWALTIPATSPVWTFTDRTDVIGAWRALVATLQGLTATPYGIAVLTEAVSRAMPQTYAETLYFAYGLQFDRGCVDLRPGLVLRVEYEGYQVPPGAQGSPLSGYVTTAVADYEVASYDRSGTWSNGIDAFLNALTLRGVVVPTPPPPGTGQQYGGGGALDAYPLPMQAPFVRLVYPPSFLLTTSPGSALPQLNAVLLAGSTLAALDAATDNIRANRAPGAGVATAYFRGRTAVRALVRVSVDGVPRLVPIGTTVGNVLAAAARRPPAGVPLAGVTLRRPRAAAVPDSGPQPDWDVRLDRPAPNPLDLPLLHGDRLDLGP
jgi:hypothetical protein